MEYSRSTRPNQAADLKTQYVPVAIGEGKHPAPFRTRKLSPLPPMVLLWRRSGRVGRRRAPLQPSRLAAVPASIRVRRSRQVEPESRPEGQKAGKARRGAEPKGLPGLPLGQVTGDAPCVELVRRRLAQAAGQRRILRQPGDCGQRLL